MKLSRAPGATSQILQIFIADSSSTTGAGLTGLTNASSGLTAYYHRDTDTTATAISLVTMTVGTFTSSGFKEIDATNMPGWYQFCPPNAALASGAKSVGFHLKGATNMAPLPIELDLAENVQTINGVSASSVTTVNANVGTTQPVNFHGTGATAYVKADAVEWDNTTTASVNVNANVTQIVGSDVATTAADGYFPSDVIKWLGTTVATPNVAGTPVVDLARIIGSVLGETAAGRLSSAFRVFFDVATPTGTVNALTTAMTESYAADAATMTPAQALYMLWSLLAQKSASALTLTTKKLDGTTTAMTFTLDSATDPTSITRTT